MSKIDPNLLVDQEWSCTFFPPGMSELAFGGKLTYKPTDGVRLTYAIPIDKRFSSNIRLLHGHTESGLPCTLVGSFRPKNGGFNMLNGHSYWTAKDHPFSYVLFGAHVEENEAFDTFQFDFSGSQEFFTRDSRKVNVPFSSEILLSSTIDAGLVEVFHTGKFDSAPRDLRAIFHSHDKEGLDELQKAYNQVQINYENFFPLLKRDHDFSFHLKVTDACDVVSGCKICISIIDFFSLLSFSPARLSRCWVIYRDSENVQYQFSVFPSILSEKGTVERCLSARDHHNLPLTMADFEFGTSLKEWVRRADEFSTVVSAIQGQGKIVSPHSILSSIVLSATQLEGIGHKAGETKDRFGHAARAFSSRKVLEQVTKYLNCNEVEVGQAISDIRNEIAHVGRPKKYLKSLSNHEKHMLAHALEVIVSGYIIEQLGISPQSRMKYQDRLT